MARPTKTGLSYFPVDVDIFEDDKMQFITARFGIKGEGIVFRLLAKIYRNGYYIDFDEDAMWLFCNSCGLRGEKELLNDIIKELVKRSFFDKTIFDSFAVLTSKGIQKRYVKICNDSKRIACNLLPEYDLTLEKTKFTTEETTITSTGNTTKESKVNKTKENKSILSENEKLDFDNVPSFVLENRKKNTSPGGERLDEKSLKFDLLENEYCKMQASRDGVKNYEAIVECFINQKFGLGENEKWKNLADARRNFTNWIPFYKLNEQKLNNGNANNKARTIQFDQNGDAIPNSSFGNINGEEGKSSNRIVAIGQRPSISKHG